MSAEELWFWTVLGATVFSIWFCLSWLVGRLIGEAIGLGGPDDERGR